MKNKGLWILLGFNIIIAIVFYVVINRINPSQVTQLIYILEMMLGVIIIEMPIALLLFKNKDK